MPSDDPNRKPTRERLEPDVQVLNEGNLHVGSAQSDTVLTSGLLDLGAQIVAAQEAQSGNGDRSAEIRSLIAPVATHTAPQRWPRRLWSRADAG